MKTIYIVEDDPNISEIEFFALKNAGYEPQSFLDNKVFQSALLHKIPDLVILDIMLPETDGLTILKQLRSNENTRNLPVILVTAKSTEIDKVRGLDIGADDYIAKPFGLMEFISRVKAVLRRSGSKNENPANKVFDFGGILVDTKSRIVTVNGKTVELTYKEFELLVMFIQNAGIVLTREVLLEKIWDTTADLESRTIDMHIKTLRKKLGDEGQRITTVRNVGYKLI